jgi:FAD/FMN-containing dehydrogenase
LHYNVQAPAGVDAAAFLNQREDEVNTLVFDAVQRFGGSISAEHGVGTLKVSKLEQHKSPVALGLMRSIKTALDPHKLMNPGKLLRI